MSADVVSPYGRTEPRVGDSAQVRKTITVADQGLYSGICGNMHPLYVNEVHAASTEAGGRLAFELVVAALATGPLAELGGANRRISALDLRFPAITRVGDTVAARAEVTEVADGDARCRVSCVRDEGDSVVAEGTAVLSEVR